MTEAVQRPLLRLLAVIADRHKSDKITELVRRSYIPLHYIARGEGTASSEILDWLGLGRTDKVVMLCVAPKPMIHHLMSEMNRELQLVVPGHGVAFTLPLSGVSNSLFRLLDEETKERLQSLLDGEAKERLKNLLDDETRQRLRNQIESEVEKMKSEASFDLIMAIINQGYSEELMTAARKAGATGGTVLSARGMGQEEPMKVWGISVQAEKEIVLILTKKENNHEIMKAIGKQCGFSTDAHGLIFSLPVDSVAGLEMASLKFTN